MFFSNQGVNTGLSVATVSTPLVYSSFWMLACVQLVAEPDALLLPPLAVLLDEVLPQAATTEPMSAVAAAATMMRRI